MPDIQNKHQIKLSNAVQRLNIFIKNFNFLIWLITFILQEVEELDVENEPIEFYEVLYSSNDSVLK